MYYNKYLKYKIKYLELKNQQLLQIQEGGSFPLVLLSGSITLSLIGLIGLIRHYTDNETDKYNDFIQKIFTFLKEYNMCFLSGTLIFEDENNRLFNILTYYEDSTEPCLNNNNKIIHYTTTHNDVFTKKDVKPDECLKFSKNNKLQIIFKSPIYYLCDQKTDTKDKNNESIKSVLLYYRFSYNYKNYIFFKLESHHMNSIGHLFDLIDQTRHDTYDKRRENKKYKDQYDKNKDIKFYEIISPLINLNIDDIKTKLKYYDDNLRTGQELFIIEELKNYFLKFI
jgi:hypothetical protein